MKFTQYFFQTRERNDRKWIKTEWIEQTVHSPIRRETQTDGRIKVWAYISDENKYLRVILLSDGETVHNAFFNRYFREDNA